MNDSSDLIWILKVIDEMILAIVYVLLYKLSTTIANTMLITCLILGFFATFPYAIKDDDDFVRNVNIADSIMLFLMFIITVIFIHISAFIWVIPMCLTVMDVVRFFVYKHYDTFWGLWIIAFILDIAANILFFV